VLGIAPDGTAKGTASDVQRTGDHVKWVGLVPTSRGTVCVWAEETPSGDANVLGAALDPDGHPRSMPARVAQRVAGWQALAAGDGAALSLLTLGPNDGGPSHGTLAWLRLDADARPIGDALPVIRRPIVAGDVDVVPSGPGWLFGWTDRGGEDAQVMLARFDGAGHVDGPIPALRAVGGSSLVGLAGGPQGAALAWESPRGRERPEREVRMALVDTAGDPVAHPAASIELASGATPEIAPIGAGFAVLAPAHACLAGAGASPCRGPTVPTFVRFDAHLGAVQAEPLFVGPQRRDPAALAWGLRCFAPDRCAALAVPGDAPTPVFTVDLASRASPFAVPNPPEPAPGAPRVSGVATLASGQAFEDVAAAPVGDATIVVALAGAGDVRAPGPRTRDASDDARIALRVVDAAGQSVVSARTLAAHPLPVGGVAVAAGGGAEDGALVAWVAREGGDPEVDVARLDATGRTVHEARLTHAKGDASDVAVTWAGDGWVVAWVDTRDGEGEVYATKVDRDLKRVARDQRITTAPGDAGGVALAAAGDVVWVAWSDPRESPREGTADIFVTSLHARDATPAGEEVRILATARHSRSPRIAPTADGGAVVAWIEDAPTGLEGTPDAMMAKLDASGHVVATPSLWPCGGRAHPTAVSLAADRAGVRAIAACAAPDGVTLQAARLGVGGTLERPPTAIFDLDAPPSFDVAVAFAGDALVFDDVGRSPGDHRVRRAVVSW
jgi:hypothetical protein